MNGIEQNQLEGEPHMDTKERHKVYYYLNRLLSNTWAWFYIAIGSRGRGKTTSAWRWVLKRYLKSGEKFMWLRLTDSPLQKMRGSGGITLVQQVILDELKIVDVKLKGNVIYIKKTNKTPYEECGLMDSLSTFYTTKGSDLSRYTNIVLDEFNRESGERRTFDVVRSFINEIETIARTRTNVRVLMLANVITEVSDILSIFNFQPQEFGLYKLRRMHCVIEYLADSPEWKEYSKNTLSRTLLKNAGDTVISFENSVDVDYSNILKFNNRYRPIFIFYLTNTNKVEFYSISGNIEKDGMLVDKVRNENVPSYKLNAYISADAIYDKQLVLEIQMLLGANILFFTTTMKRQNFLLDFKATRK